MGQLEDILKHQNMVRNNIMKSFGAETSEDSLEKSFEDEVNPFEMEAYKSELTKAELDEFEKAKHQDGDMHPNGKWVWRQSANGGKGDWRVAKTGGSKATAGGASAATSSNTLSDKEKKSSSSTKSGDETSQQSSSFDSYLKKYGEDTDTEEGRMNFWTHQLMNQLKQGSKVLSTAKFDSLMAALYNADDKKFALTLTNTLLNAFSDEQKEARMLKSKYNKLLERKEHIENQMKKMNDTKKKSEKSSYESKEADAYDKGDGKVGNYPVPTHTSYPAANLYSRLKNNRHFGFKYGLPEEEIMKKLKNYKGNVKVSYHNNAGTSEIYRIKFL